MAGVLGFLANIAGGTLVKDIGDAVHENITTDKDRISLDIEADKLQTDINKVEAASPHIFVAGWRPAVGWVGVGSLALVTWPKAVVLTVFWCLQACHAFKANLPLPVYPDLGTSDVIMLLSSMLGIGAMRSYEKKNGVATMGVRGK